MILSDREIRSANARSIIGVSDLPPPESKRWAPHALDLTLDEEIRIWAKEDGQHGVEPPIFAPGTEGFTAESIVAQYTQPDRCDGLGYLLLPQHFVLGWTVEKIRLPYESRIGARVEGKSSLARLGLGVHITAPTIHPGFGAMEGGPEYPGSPLRLEIWNVGVYRIRLTKGMAICQILFEEVHGVPDAGYTGQYAAQGPNAALPEPPPPKSPSAAKARKK